LRGRLERLHAVAIWGAEELEGITERRVTSRYRRALRDVEKGNSGSWVIRLFYPETMPYSSQ
jgi:hypothetical protein